MQVHIQTTIPGEKIPEWVLVELQGDLESRNQEALSDKYIGDLHFTKKGVPILIIGHHILYGKLVVMEKPYVAIKKDVESELEEIVEYTLQAVIKRKIIFKSRPKPIIVNSAKPK